MPFPCQALQCGQSWAEPVPGLFEERVPMAPTPPMHPAISPEGMAELKPSELGLLPRQCESMPDALLKACGQATRPTPLQESRLLAVSPGASALLGLSSNSIEHSEPWRRLLSGEACLQGIAPVATAYAGHQFGVGVPRLGDGRAHSLGRVEGWELQLKGAGPTPFSRGADGRAVLRSSIREFLVSEYLSGLGVPSTRALALVGSRSHAIRETVEPAAIVCRMAPSFLRFGHFEWVARHAPEHLPGLYALAGCEDSAEALVLACAQRTGTLVGLWLAEGFVHGVMNTDNLSPLGITLDHGPYAFLDAFDAMAVYNHSDGQGRYAFARQPQAALWSLGRLAVALGLPGQGFSEAQLRAAFEPALQFSFESRMAAKLGLPGEAARPALPVESQSAVTPVLNALFPWAQANRVDLQHFLRQWAEAGCPNDMPSAPPGFATWRSLLPGRLDAASALQAIPAWGLRTWVLEEIIRSAEDHGDLGLLWAALLGCANPYEIGTAEGAEHRIRWTNTVPSHAQNIALSCSS